MNETPIHRIEQKLASIERRLGDLSAPLRSAFGYRRSDPQSALTKCRILLETVLRNIHEHECGTTPDAHMVGQLLANKHLRARLPRRMLAKMNMIRELANLGAHGDDVSCDDAEMTLLNIVEVLEWYSDTYEHGTQSSTDTLQVGRELLSDFAARLKHPLRSEVTSVRIARTSEDVYLQLVLCHRDNHLHFPWAGDTREVTNRYNLAQVLGAPDGTPTIDPRAPIAAIEAEALAHCDEEVFWVLDANLFTEDISDAILHQLSTRSA